MNIAEVSFLAFKLINVMKSFFLCSIKSVYELIAYKEGFILTGFHKKKNVKLASKKLKSVLISVKIFIQHDQGLTFLLAY